MILPHDIILRYNTSIMQSSSTITPSDVIHIAALAAIPVTDEETKKLADGFTTTLQVVEDLKTAQTGTIEPTHQVTGLENVLREDVVDEERMFTQEEALRNAPRTHDGFFVVDQILDRDE